MTNDKVRSVLAAVAAGSMGVEAAVERLRRLPYEDLGFAKLDHHRALRDHLPEVVLGIGKTPEQVAAIAERLVEQSGRLLVTRVGDDTFAALKARLPDAEYHAVARAITVDRAPRPLLPGVMVLCAGTADLPVAEEAALVGGAGGLDGRRVGSHGGGRRA